MNSTDELRDACEKAIERLDSTFHPKSNALTKQYAVENLLEELQPLFERQRAENLTLQEGIKDWQFKHKQDMEIQAAFIDGRHQEIERLKAEVDGLRDEREAITKHMEHMALDEMPDGRRIRDNKIPWEQFVCMVMDYYKAEVERLQLDCEDESQRLRDCSQYNKSLRKENTRLQSENDQMKEVLELTVKWAEEAYGKDAGDFPLYASEAFKIVNEIKD